MCLTHIPISPVRGRKMILEEETYAEFGYYPSDLSPKSGKRILAACDDCGKIREMEKVDYRALCKSCVRKGKRHPNFGKKGEGNSNWKGGKVKRICETCGNEFEVNPSLIKRGYGKFCSHVCANKPRKRREKRICETCGKEFEVKLYVIKRGDGRFCSQSCARKKKVIPTHHTKPEMIFEAICKKYSLPYKYTGDSSFWIGKNPAINPDFVECNGKKIAVEIFSYWHDPLRRHCKVPYSRTYEGRKKLLKEYGWKLVVFWQEDLECEDTEEFVLSQLQKEEII